MTKSSSLFVICLYILSTSLPSFAVEPPSSTTAKYADWAVRCNLVTPQENADAVNICEMVQIISIATPNKSEASQVLAQIAIGKLPESSIFKIIFQLPSGVYLRQPISLSVNENSLLKASYFRCLNGGCFADAELSGEQISTLSSAKKAEFSFTDGAQRKINIPFSVNGFDAAFGAIQSQQ